MDALGQIAQAARALAPDSRSGVGSYAQDLTCTAATATAATSTGIPAHGGFFSWSCGQAFNIRFGGSAVADPADTAAFPAGLYQMYLDGTQTKFKITANVTGKACYWRSSAG